jgi:hypothetical protein
MIALLATAVISVGTHGGLCPPPAHLLNAPVPIIEHCPEKAVQDTQNGRYKQDDKKSGRDRLEDRKVNHDGLAQ